METKIVTRHAGAMEWIAKHHLEFGDAEVIAHADVGDLKGRRIIGMLPIHMAAMCKEYWHLEMTVPADRRGTEISCEDMENFGCKISQFLVVAPGDFCQVCYEIGSWTHDGLRCAECGAPRKGQK